MSLRYRWALGLALLLTPATAPAQDADTPLTAPRPQTAAEPPGRLEIVPEAYEPRELGNRYFDDARAYLQDHPDSPFAPRIRFDMLLVAEELEMDDTAADARAELFLAHPKSRQCRWLLKTFHTADDVRNALLAAVEKRPWDAELTAGLTPLFEISLEKWPDALIDRPSEIMYLAALASIHEPSPAIDRAVDEIIAHVNRPELSRAVDVLCDRSAAAPKLFAALLDASIDDEDLARLIPEIESRPQGNEVSEMYALWMEFNKQTKERAYEGALVTLEKLSKRCPGQRVLWCELLTAAVLGQTEKMVALEHKIRVLGPRTAWANIAETLLLANDRRQECIDMLVRAWLASIDAADPDRALRMQLDLSLWNGAPGDLLTSWHAALQTDFTSMHSLALQERGETLIQIEQTRPNVLRVYFPTAGADQVFLHDVKFGNLLSTAGLDFNHSTRTFRFDYWFGMNSNPKHTGLSIKTYFPFSESGLRQFCDDQRYSWLFPMSCEERDDRYRIVWGGFLEDSPRLQKVAWEIHKEGFLHSLRFENDTEEHFGTLLVEYGNRDQIALDAVAWPDLPERELSLPVAFLRYMQGGTQVLERYSKVKHPELQEALTLVNDYLASHDQRNRPPGQMASPRIATDPKSSLGRTIR